MNGLADKCDANFLDSFFIEKVDGKQIFIGSYPLYDSDVGMLANYGITSVLNIQTDKEMMSRSVNESRLN